MATKKTEPVVTEAKPVEKTNGGIGENATFTYSIKSNSEEMLVIRHNDPEELLRLRAFFLQVIPKDGELNKKEREKRSQAHQDKPVEEKKADPIQPPARAKTAEHKPTNEARKENKGDKPYMHESDDCPDCEGGFLEVCTAKSQTTGAPYQYLACSNRPDCKFTAWKSKFAKKTA